MKTKDVPASPVFCTACEKVPSVRKEPKFRSTKAKKRINFDQQEGTQGEQSLSQLYGNPPRSTYAEISAARSKSLIFNPVDLLSQT